MFPAVLCYRLTGSDSGGFYSVTVPGINSDYGDFRHSDSDLSSELPCLRVLKNKLLFKQTKLNIHIQLTSMTTRTIKLSYLRKYILDISNEGY